MQTDILEYLEKSAERCPEKTAFADEVSSLTYGQLKELAQRAGTYIENTLGGDRRPVMVLMKKSPENLAAFFAVLSSGRAYVPLDCEMPPARAGLIKGNLMPAAVITGEGLSERATELFGDDIRLIDWEEAAKSDADSAVLERVAAGHLDTDPAYILYTSGSTGVPKGVVVSHRSLIDYVDNFCEGVDVKSDEVIASQAPFYFDASLIDIYCTLKMGGTLHIVPLPLFSQPIKLLEFLKERSVTMIRWVPSAMGIVSTFRALDSLRPESLRLIIFGAESMPVKCFDYWRAHYPDSRFVQIYGPTEITGICTYYEVPADRPAGEVIPIGRAIANSGVFLLDENDRLIAESDAGVTGEICVKGSCLAHGYYNDFERTRAVFVQNPLNSLYPELIYRTGDLAYYNEKGDLVFASRKDFQIKHMGHRIELGEIEAAALSVEGVNSAVCFFDTVKNRIHMAYVSEGLGDSELIEALKQKVPRYMIPNVFHRMDSIPMTPSGKADRVRLKEEYI
ncbi:MAG: amino acid adenylation domain-containing protein [Lachnospiraceae bacterium]|nr:amino acid adenylation domain-containing protein [Lachnospiraceae bacterium]